MRAPAFVRVPFVLTGKCQVLVSSDALTSLLTIIYRESSFRTNKQNKLNTYRGLLSSGQPHTDEEQETLRCNSTTSQNVETSDAEDDISVGDNRSETSTPKKSQFSFPDEYKKKIDGEETERSSPLEYNLNNQTNYSSPFKEDENEYENRPEERMKLYDTSLFHLYRPDRDNKKEEGAEGAGYEHMPGLSDSIYGRSMDLSKNSFQSQLLAGFASVIAGNTQRESQESNGRLIFNVGRKRYC